MSSEKKNNITSITIIDQRQRLAADAIPQKFGVEENNTLDKITDNMPGDEKISQIDESHNFLPNSLPEYLQNTVQLIYNLIYSLKKKLMKFKFIHQAKTYTLRAKFAVTKGPFDLCDRHLICHSVKKYHIL